MRIQSKFLLACVPSLALVLGLGLTQVHADDGDAPAAVAQVQVTPLKRGTLPRTVAVYGTVQSSTATRESLSAPGAARVAEIRVRVGDVVAKGAPLVLLAPTPAAAAGYAQARSALHVAADLLARTRTMIEQHLATAQQLADAEKGESDARATLAQLEAQGAGGALLLRAPYPATVTALSTSVGSVVDVGGALLELARPSDLVLAAGVVPQSASQIAVGNAAHVTPIGGGRTVGGRVSLRGGAVDAASGLVPVELTLPADSLLPGQTATATITTGLLKGFVVPHSAVLLNDEGDTYVVQVVGGVAKKVPVTVLGRQEDQDAVDGELTENAPLVLAGNYQVDDGMKVQIAPPAGSADKGDQKDDAKQDDAKP